jgi:predicted secreted hydrolase
MNEMSSPAAIRRPLAALALLSLMLLAACNPAARPAISSSVELPGRDASIAGFTRATAPIAFSWPRDHGPHDDFLLEWWYYTGNVQDASGRPFGYQLTIFRRALTAPSTITRTVDSAFAFDQIYSAHFAISDIQAQKHHAFERLSRSAAGLSGGAAEPFNIWIDNWSMTQQALAGQSATDAALQSPGNVRLVAREGAFAIDLQLRAEKAPVLQGDRGYSPKGKNPGNASYYYSFTRLATSGTLTVDARDYQVSGSSWMDHEWSTSFLDENAIGWEWLALQLNDGSELVVFQINNKDGAAAATTYAAFVAPDGSVTPVPRDALTFTPTRTWRSPNSNKDYRNAWRIDIPSQQLTLDVSARFDAQEAQLSTVYYEGAVGGSGTRLGKPVEVVGYLEITSLGVGE